MRRKKAKKQPIFFLIFLAGFLLAPIFGREVYAGNPDYQRCKAGETCILGEFLYDDEYQPYVTASCTLTSRDPSGEIFLNAVEMTAHSDGWYSKEIDTTGQTEGLYRSQMCCTTASDYLCLDKSFYIGPSYLSTSDVAGAVWNAQTSTYNTENTFGANLQNPVLTAAQVWGYTNRTLTSFGSLIADIWSYSTRSLTTFGTLVADIWENTTRTLTSASLSGGEQLATLNNLETATQSAVLSIKTDEGYDLGDIIGYVDTLENTLGASTDASGSATIFGRLTGIQQTVDRLSAIDVDIDSLVGKWGSYSASDIYDKVKNLSSEISAINTVSNVSSILSLSQTNATDIKELKNKVSALKAIVEVNRSLLEKVSNQPIVKTWLEEGSIIFKTLINNPSKTTSQTVPLKYFLPKEVKKENIIKMDEGLKVDYDAAQEAYFVYGEFELKPEETKILSVEVEDIWKISEEEVDSLRKQAEELTKPLKGTSYFAQGQLVKSDINLSLDKILRLQREAVTPQGRIRAFREAKGEMEAVKNKMETLKTLVASAGSMGTMFGFIGGVQTLGVWGMIIVLIAGVVFLALYLRQISLPPEEKFKLPGFLGKIMGGKTFVFILVLSLSFGLTVFGVSLILKEKSLSKKAETGLIIVSTPTPTPEEKNQEIEISEEKQVLGEYTQREGERMIIPSGGVVEVKEAPTSLSKVLERLGEGEEVEKLGEWENWVKIRWEKKGVSCLEGWVNKKFIRQ